MPARPWIDEMPISSFRSLTYRSLAHAPAKETMVKSISDHSTDILMARSIMIGASLWCTKRVLRVITG